MATSVSFRAPLLKYGQHGEKTGWTYLDIPPELAEQLKPGQRTSFRVKGRLDQHPIQQLALVPVGEGAFILVLNADLRRAIRKQAGDTVLAFLEADDALFTPSNDLLTCLADDPEAQAFFDSLSVGHQRYYTNWVEQAKTPATKARRIAQALTGFSLKMGYPEMIRHFKKRDA